MIDAFVVITDHRRCSWSMQFHGRIIENVEMLIAQNEKVIQRMRPACVSNGHSSCSFQWSRHKYSSQQWHRARQLRFAPQIPYGRNDLSYSWPSVVDSNMKERKRNSLWSIYPLCFAVLHHSKEERELCAQAKEAECQTFVDTWSNLVNISWISQWRWLEHGLFVSVWDTFDDVRRTTGILPMLISIEKYGNNPTSERKSTKTSCSLPRDDQMKWNV